MRDDDDDDDDSDGSCVKPKESESKQAKRQNENQTEYDNDEDEDDQLLTQALNEQETRILDQDNSTAQVYTPSPPTKKVSALFYTATLSKSW